MEKNEEFVGFAVEARKYQTLLTEKYKNRKPWVAPNPKHILSHIPGTIVDILVKEGQSLKKGDLLLIHEAMKMQNRVVMPCDGVIDKINVTVGEKIAKNFVMIELK
ncbi:MAG: acetyl-CoA carboxylase biotin carboxyl carrier protein subunit [Paludibacteraceae bacterium]|mgnify:FL=1|nr:acetyl-CoA carboxylase biotin carboxyl carrier protein subunit [Paludibacteraceae bacterium]